MQQWLDLSVNSNVPISLLIMSRTFFLKEEMSSLPSTKDAEKQVEGLQDVISGMDEEVVNEVLLEVATPEESRSDIDVIKVKLEVLEAANEKIDEEAEARQKAEEKKEREKKEKKAKGEKEEREEKELEMGEERVLAEAPESAGAEVKLETDAGAEVVSTKKSVDPVIFQEVGGSGPEVRRARSEAISWNCFYSVPSSLARYRRHHHHYTILIRECHARCRRRLRLSLMRRRRLRKLSLRRRRWRWKKRRRIKNCRPSRLRQLEKC